MVITTGRPGLLIGKRGKNVDALEAHLGCKIKIVEDPDPLWYYLIPSPPEPEDCWAEYDQLMVLDNEQEAELERLYEESRQRRAKDGGEWPEYTGPGR